MRLDQALVERGLAPSRARAQQLIRAGNVLLDGAPVTKPSAMVANSDGLALAGDALDYVSRAAVKLIGGLDGFGLDPTGLTALDLGASTGGFTEVLLRRGVRKVYSVDVGHGQLHQSLRNHPRVVPFEGLHARDLCREHIPEPIDLVVCDVSFISVLKALPPALALTAADASLVCLVKPQFELGPDAIGKNGRVLTSKAGQREHIEKHIVPFFAGLGWRQIGLMDSPIPGGEGTKEFLLYAEKTAAEASGTQA